MEVPVIPKRRIDRTVCEFEEDRNVRSREGKRKEKIETDLELPSTSAPRSDLPPREAGPDSS